MGEFGSKFRKAREKKQLSFEDVSNVLKISSRMLQAIEEEHFDLLPGGVFNKGFIRAYAKHLDLDPEECVNEYLAGVRQTQMAALDALESQSASSARSSVKLRVMGSQKSEEVSQSPIEIEELPDLQLPRAEHVRGAKKEYLQGRREGTPWSLIAAAIVVIVLAVLVWVRHSRRTRAAAAPPAAASVTPPVVPATAPSPEPPVSKKSWPPQSNVSLQPKSGGGTPRSTTTATPVAAETKPAALSLVIRAAENSWVSVQADGKSVINETLIAPARTSVHANQEIVVKVGNAAGVSFEFNGVEISPQGNESEVKTLVFDPTGMKLPP